MNEVVDIELDIDGNVMPEKNDKIALIDADTLAFAACLNVEQEEEVLPKEMYTEMEWEAIINDPQYTTNEMGCEVIYTCDVDMAMVKAEEKLQRILDKTGCTDCELHFTSGRNNFRYKVKDDYKANRLGKKAPAGLGALKIKMLEKYKGSISDEWEADDMVVYLKKKYPEKYILVALDKDVYNSLAGRHFNYYESQQYNIEMKWVEISEGTARMWPYLQCILGDKTDNIKGCKGIGPKKALKFINEDMTEEELWKGVVKAWESKGMTESEAMVTMNLVNMHLLKEVDGKLKIELWSPYE